MAIAVEDVIRAVIRSQQAEQAGINVLHFRVSAVVDAGWTMKLLAQELFDALVGEWTALMANTAQFVRVTASIVAPTAHKVAGGDSTAAPEPGTAGATPGPRQATGMLTLRTGVVGSKGRGRIYFPFVATDDMAGGGVPTAGYQTRLDAVGTLLTSNLTLVSGGNSVTLVPSIFHRSTNLSTRINETVSRLKFATQKRRGSYGRPNPL